MSYAASRPVEFGLSSPIPPVAGPKRFSALPKPATRYKRGGPKTRTEAKMMNDERITKSYAKRFEISDNGVLTQRTRRFSQRKQRTGIFLRALCKPPRPLRLNFQCRCGLVSRSRFFSAFQISH